MSARINLQSLVSPIFPSLNKLQNACAAIKVCAILLPVKFAISKSNPERPKWNSLCLPSLSVCTRDRRGRRVLWLCGNPECKRRRSKRQNKALQTPQSTSYILEQSKVFKKSTCSGGQRVYSIRQNLTVAFKLVFHQKCCRSLRWCELYLPGTSTQIEFVIAIFVLLFRLRSLWYVRMCWCISICAYLTSCIKLLYSC